jgi:hypothetical protein
MIPYELDPSLHNAQPQSTMLDDGFSPPQSHPRSPEAPQDELSYPAPDRPADPALRGKSAS